MTREHKATCCLAAPDYGRILRRPATERQSQKRVPEWLALGLLNPPASGRSVAGGKPGKPDFPCRPERQMPTISDNSTPRVRPVEGATPASGDNGAAALGHSEAREAQPCFHCGTPCPSRPPTIEDKPFCCQGCLIVYELLTENGLGQFYELGPQAGVRVGQTQDRDRFRFLDDETVSARLLDFADERISKVTLQIPAIHCIACVWLLENLFRLKPGVGRSIVNFPRREVAITFEHGRLKLSELVAFHA
jgi:hypothetical protein